MEKNQFLYLAFLKFASETMVQSFRAECFIQWMSEYIIGKLESSHISVALYDKQKDFYPVRASAGERRLPPGLVAIKKVNPFDAWFDQSVRKLEAGNPKNHPPLCQIVTYRQAQSEARPLSDALMAEMKRYRADVCASIQTHDRLAGYLLIGSPENNRNYALEEILFFETLANDIAIEIEKEKYYKMSHYDALTELFNRGSLKIRFQEMVAGKSDFAVAFLDLDHFKQVNDQYGHLAGDEVLRITGEIIQQNIRKTDIAFRYGGEEFLILLERVPRNSPPEGSGDDAPSGTLAEEARGIMERLRQAVSERPFHCLGHILPVSVSIGVSFRMNGEAKSQENLIREADQALYASKRNGRNQVTLYNESLAAA